MRRVRTCRGRISKVLPPTGLVAPATALPVAEDLVAQVGVPAGQAEARVRPVIPLVPVQGVAWVAAMATVAERDRRPMWG